METLTGPRSPLRISLDRYRTEVDRIVTRYASVIGLIHNDRRGRFDDMSVYGVPVQVPESWRYVGNSAHDMYRQLLNQRDYVEAGHGLMGGFREPRDVARDREPAPFRRLEAAEQVISVVEQAVTRVAIALAIALESGAITAWGSDETVIDAARRLPAEAITHDVGQDHAPDDVEAAFEAFLAYANWTCTPAREWAQRYLDRREQINTALRRHNVRWGGRMLHNTAAAVRALVADSTWRSYVARGQAPKPDEYLEWREATVDAWRLTRTRGAATAASNQPGNGAT